MKRYRYALLLAILSAAAAACRAPQPARPDYEGIRQDSNHAQQGLDQESTGQPNH